MRKFTRRAFVNGLNPNSLTGEKMLRPLYSVHHVYLTAYSSPVGEGYDSGVRGKVRVKV